MKLKIKVGKIICKEDVADNFEAEVEGTSSEIKEIIDAFLRN